LAPFINCSGITSSNLWSRNWLEKVGMWNESLQSSQEADLMLRLVLCGADYKIDKAPKTVIREREAGQISTTNISENLKRYLNVRLDYMANLKLEYHREYERYLPEFNDYLLVTILQLAKTDAVLASEYFSSLFTSDWN